MKYTNKHNLPDLFRLWLEVDDYDYHPGVWSITRLMKPTRMVVLEKRHEDELECDISDLIAARYGTIIHDSVEKLDLPNTIQEKRFFGEIDGQKISGKPDLLEIANDVFNLADLKSTSVWGIVFNDKEEDYIHQLSGYRWLVMNGKCEEDLGDVPTLVSREGTIYFWFTDWSRKQALAGGNYPPLRIAMNKYKLMSTEDTEAYLRGRLQAILHYLNNPSESLPRCTVKELWQKPWVMKKGRKTPVKKFQKEEEALQFLEQMDEDHYFEWSPVQRCNYCSARKWCEQFKEMDAKGIIAEG